MDKIHSFYTRKPWRDLSYTLKIARNGKCNRCKKIYLDTSKLIGHHTVKLNEINVDNPQIALNPELIEIICLDCHNKEHRRFGHQHSKQVYIIHGSPLSGKSTLAKELMLPGDIVLDIDLLYSAISGLPVYDKPETIRFNVFRLRDNLLDQIKTRYGDWGSAYIIGGYPDKYERERLATSMGAELIHCEASKEECIERCHTSAKPVVWLGYIDEYWRKFTA